MGGKRPERFFEIALKFPEVDFIAVGGSQDKRGTVTSGEPTGHSQLGNDWSHRPILHREPQPDSGKSWILINTSPREGLPNAF